ncbi:LamG domain-containing protein [Prolixibacteraceae bacterium Z1-6]|uniref:LamG domain-containing protein n=1 Tax=Draconibacterium aestuarii TaxID=2998507 RepID=A0A9X3F7Q6_9BACT|nr:LamG domain-containing protein [Prolixibacteraceae bacterium Z1-6]
MLKENSKQTNNRYFFTGFFMVLFILFQGCDTTKTEYWVIDNLEKIGGYNVSVVGNPEIVETELGKAVKFDGDGDLLLVDSNPLGNTKEFTVEVIFKPAACYPENTAPRFIHFQDPNDLREKRLMIELRINEQNQCYLDGYLKTDTSSLVLIDETLVHPTNEWLHAAVTYQNNCLTTYINGQKQLSGEVGYKAAFINPEGKVAIGGRMNKVSWYNGLVKTVKVTDKALDPEGFMAIND